MAKSAPSGRRRAQSLSYWSEISKERTFGRSFGNSLEGRAPPPRTYSVERSDDDDDDDADLVLRGRGEVGGKVGWDIMLTP